MLGTHIAKSLPKVISVPLSIQIAEIKGQIIQRRRILLSLQNRRLYNRLETETKRLRVYEAVLVTLQKLPPQGRRARVESETING